MRASSWRVVLMPSCSSACIWEALHTVLSYVAEELRKADY